MKTKKTLFSFLLFLALSPGFYAQKAQVAAGGEATGSGGMVSYSIGQVDYVSESGSGGTSNQGVQQPYSITDGTGIEIKNITLDFVAYPVPTIDNVSLKVSGQEFGKIKFTLISLDGKILVEQDILSDITLIHLDNYSQSMYILNVLDSSNKLIKSFNIIKN